MNTRAQLFARALVSELLEHEKTRVVAFVRVLFVNLHLLKCRHFMLSFALP